MRKASTVLLALLAFVVSVPGLAGEAESLAKAKALFERYVALGEAFDPALADLYADEALIRNRRTYPTGEVKDMTLPAPKYKEIVRAAIPLAKDRGDTSTYSEVKYTPEGEGVRITATRFSNLKKYASASSLLVKSGPTGEWLIYEELSESRP